MQQTHKNSVLYLFGLNGFMNVLCLLHENPRTSKAIVLSLELINEDIIIGDIKGKKALKRVIREPFVFNPLLLCASTIVEVCCVI